MSILAFFSTVELERNENRSQNAWVIAGASCSADRTPLGLLGKKDSHADGRESGDAEFSTDEKPLPQQTAEQTDGDDTLSGIR